MGRSHRIHATMHNHLVEHQSTVLETLGKLNSMDVTILIDLGASKSFISPNSLIKCKLVEIKKKYFDWVEMASSHSKKLESLVHDFPINLGVCITYVILYVTYLGHYEVIIGMD
jgi:hypothetical protein